MGRYVLELRALPDAKTKTVRSCFERHGLPEPSAATTGRPLRSVQGLLGLSQLSSWWLANGIDLERRRTGCPQDNGGHERMHRDIAWELKGQSYEDRQAAFDTWRCEYNQERPHESLGMRVPEDVYESGTRPWYGTPEEVYYPGKTVRKVNGNGHIKYEGEMIRQPCPQRVASGTGVPSGRIARCVLHATAAWATWIRKPPRSFP
jgi:hypothetical protein